MLESLDLDAPTTLTTTGELHAEVDRLLALVRPLPRYEVEPTRHAHVLEDWRARDCDAAPAAPDQVPDSELVAVSLPHTRTADYVHLRHAVVLDATLGDRPVLRFEAADYEADVWVDGEHRGHHRGYFAPFEVPMDGLRHGPHQVDVVTRRARDMYRWSGESEALNFGDAHGKGLGSVVDDAVTAGAGLLGQVRLESRPAVRVVDHLFSGTPAGSATVQVELDGVATGPVGVNAEVLDGGTVVAAATATTHDLTTAVTLALDIPDARAWSSADPHLYVLRIRVDVAGDVVDEVGDLVGLRTIDRLDDGSLRLNGEPMFLRGTTTIGCLWDAGWSGDEEAVLRQLLVVKALFGNVLRVHVHVLPRLVYRCADRVGVLIYQDAPLQWHCFEPRKDALGEELEQAAELARHVRNHPSVVVLSLTNEMHMAVPFHDSDLEYTRRSKEITESLVGSMVLYQDWPGTTRPRDLPRAFHDYPGYFSHTSTAEDSVLDWDGEGVRAVVSEYGAGAIPSWRAMQASVAAHQRPGREPITLPDSPDGPWTAEEGTYAQTGELLDMHQRMVGLQPSFAAYHAASGAVQARTLTYQTGRMRRDRDRVVGVIQHYLQNPGPHFYNPWIDLHIIDSAGEITAGLPALREAFRPVAVDVVGLPARAYPNAPLEAAVWCYNDLSEAVDGELECRWISADGAVLAKTTRPVRLAPDSAAAVATAAHAAPADGTVALHVSLTLEGRPWAQRRTEVTVHPAPEPLEDRVAVLGDVAGLTERAADWLTGIEPYGGPETAPDLVVVTPRTELDHALRQELLELVERGTRVVLLERPPAESLGWLSPRTPAIVAQGQINELASVDISMLATGMTTADLSRWATHDGRVVTDPLITMDRRGTPVWARCGHRLQMAAVQEFTVGRGTAIVCQLHVWDAMAAEPMAAQLLRHTLVAPVRPL